MFYARADWLARKWIASTIHIRVAEEKKISGQEFNFRIFFGYILSSFFGICVAYTKTFSYSAPLGI